MQNAGAGMRTRASASASDDATSAPSSASAGAARDDDVLAPRQRPPQRLPGPAAHDDRVPGGQRAESLQVLGQPPRQRVAGADDAVARDRRDERDGRHGGSRGGVQGAVEADGMRKVRAARGVAAILRHAGAGTAVP